jgi:hypothetical protein
VSLTVPYKTTADWSLGLEMIFCLSVARTTLSAMPNQVSVGSMPWQKQGKHVKA